MPEDMKDPIGAALHAAIDNAPDETARDEAREALYAHRTAQRTERPLTPQEMERQAGEAFLGAINALPGRNSTVGGSLLGGER